MAFPSLIRKPWPQRGFVFLLGIMGALGFAPLFFLPLLLLSFSGLWFLLEQEIEEKASFRKIFWLGWWFGLGHFTAGLYWVSYALTIDLTAFWWLIPFALFGLPSLLAIFSGTACTLTKLWPYQGLSQAFAFSAIWVSTEWLRGHILTGFPWNLEGYGWAFRPEMIQLASLTSVYGLSLLTLLMAVSLQYFLSKFSRERKISFTIYLIAGLMWGWGMWRLSSPLPSLTSPPLALRLVQPNIVQTLKWDPTQQEANFQKLLTMTKKPSILSLRAIIWPESAISFFLEQDAFRRTLIADALPKGAFLFTGALRRTPPGRRPFELWNSLLVVDDQANIRAYYDKFHLVPFGEYVPFRDLWDRLLGKGSLKKITVGIVDFTPGPCPQSIEMEEGFPSWSGLVCYEAIFPGAVISSTQKRPKWMINVTNDAWYGNTSGPYQHLEAARFRAIEEGIPLVRVANSGISAVFDAYGRNRGSIGLGKEGILDVWLPSPLSSPPLYARWGDWITLGLIIGTLGLAYIISLKGKRNKSIS